jgi:hypothetical protein
MNNSQGYQSIQSTQSAHSVQITDADMHAYIRRNRFNIQQEKLTITHNVGCCLSLYISVQIVFFILITVFLFLKH